MNPMGSNTSFSKLLVSDMDRSVAFYEALGFERVQTDPVFLHLRWAPGADLYLVRMPAGVVMEGRRGLGVLLCFTTLDVDVSEIAGRAVRAGARVEGPVLEPWHTREIIVSDPDGYRINFVQPA